MNPDERRDKRLQLLEDHIGRALAASERSGELRQAPSFGKPLVRNPGWDQAPVELRLGFKILKDAGVVPPEVELMQRIEALRQSIESLADPAAADAARQHLQALRQQLALRLEKLRSSGRL